MAKHELKPAAFYLLRQGKSAKDVAATLGIGESTVRRWVRESGQSLRSKEHAELEALSYLELNRWVSKGPLFKRQVENIGQLESAGYVVWQDWKSFMKYYERHREAFLDLWAAKREERPHLPAELIVESLYEAWKSGDVDLDEERRNLATDPERMVYVWWRDEDPQAESLKRQMHERFEEIFDDCRHDDPRLADFAQTSTDRVIVALRAELADLGKRVGILV